MRDSFELHLQIESGFEETARARNAVIVIAALTRDPVAKIRINQTVEILAVELVVVDYCAEAIPLILTTRIGPFRYSILAQFDIRDWPTYGGKSRRLWTPPFHEISPLHTGGETSILP